MKTIVIELRNGMIIGGLSGIIGLPIALHYSGLYLASIISSILYILFFLVLWNKGNIVIWKLHFVWWARKWNILGFIDDATLKTITNQWTWWLDIGQFSISWKQK